MKHLPLYLGLILLCYIASWTIAYVVVNGFDFTWYFDYLGYFWSGNGLERPGFTGLCSLVLFVPLALGSGWWLRRRRKKN